MATDSERRAAMPGFCRDCLADAPPAGARCAGCGSPRLARHPDIDSLAIAHIDCDAFYAAIEKRDDPSLADKPLIVGGGRRGVVSTACYIARTKGGILNVASIAGFMPGPGMAVYHATKAYAVSFTEALHAELGPDGVIAGIKRGGIYIDMSTIEPDESRAIAAEFDKAGAVMLDGPLSGSPVTVKAGQASVMIGGDEATFGRAKPVLLAIGPKVTRIGGNGLACQMKIAVNLLLMVEVIAFGEAVALAEKGGVSRESAVDAILKSVAASPVLGYRGPFILDGKMPEVPLADVTLQQKDMMLALNLGRRLGSPVPLAAAANEMMNACRGLGIDGNDFVVAHQVYRRLGGQE